MKSNGSLEIYLDNTLKYTIEADQRQKANAEKIYSCFDYTHGDMFSLKEELEQNEEDNKQNRANSTCLSVFKQLFQDIIESFDGLKIDTKISEPEPLNDLDNTSVQEDENVKMMDN